MEKIRMPFKGKYPMTQDYGVKVSYMRAGIHTGIDWGIPKGTPLVACFAGRVIKADQWQLKGYGREVQIQREDGLIAQYAHCSKIFVKVGTQVEIGTILAESGNTGFVISLGGGGYHLHFGIMENGKWIDPKKYLDPKKETTPPPPPAQVKIPVQNKDPLPTPDGLIHTVEKGDTLSKIARTYLGNGNLWGRIFEINKDTIANPNKIRIGQKIKIPNVKK